MKYSKILISCFESSNRGGTIFTRRLYDALNSSGLPSFFSFFALSRSSWLDLIRYLYHSIFADILIVSFPASIPYSFLFFWKRKYCIIHTPYDRLSLHTKLFFILHEFLSFRNKYLFVANHLAGCYRLSLKNFYLGLPSSFVLYPLMSDYFPRNEEVAVLDKPLDRHSLHLVFTGGSSPEKNLEFAFDVYRKLRDLRSVKFHLFGKILPSLSKELHGDPHVFQYGFVPLPWSRFASVSSFHLMPSAYEGMPLSCVEAMSYAIPTLGSQICAFSELSSISSSLVRQLPLDCSLWVSSILENTMILPNPVGDNSYDLVSRRCFDSFCRDISIFLS